MTSKAQREIHIGRQGAGWGTSVAPDVALRAQTSLKIVADKVVVDENIGSFAPGRHYVGSVKGEGTLEQSASYEEAAYTISMAMGDGGDGVGAGPYTYTFPLPEATAEDICYYSMEYTDGGNHVIAADDVFATGLNIRGEAGQAWDIEADIVSGPTVPADAMTGSIAPGESITPVHMANTALYVDPLYSNIGTTVVNELISFNLPNGRG
jgi:hypothetical protein